MPWPIEASTGLLMGTYAAAAILLLVLAGLKGVHRSGLRAGLATGFTTIAVLFAFRPYSPYKAFGHRPWRERLLDGLTEHERRLLVACYNPANRRMAVGVIVIVGVIFLVISVVLLPRMKLIWPPPIARPRDAFLFGVILSTVPAAGCGYYGVTRDIRRRWDEISSEGYLWPLEIEYSGPFLYAAKSFFTGRLPDFILSSPENAEPKPNL